MLGSMEMTASKAASGTFIFKRVFPLALITARRSVWTAEMSSCFSLSAKLFLFASSSEVDSSMTSMIFRPFFLRVEPVSVRSTTTSVSSGTLASVAPKENWMSTGIPRFEK